MSSRKNGIAMFSYRRMYRYFRVKKAKKELKGQTHIFEASQIEMKVKKGQKANSIL